MAEPWIKKKPGKSPAFTCGIGLETASHNQEFRRRTATVAMQSLIMTRKILLAENLREILTRNRKKEEDIPLI